MLYVNTIIISFERKIKFEEILSESCLNLVIKGKIGFVIDEMLLILFFIKLFSFRGF